MSDAALQLPTFGKLREIGIDAFERDGNVHIRLRRFSPLTAGLLTLAVALFLLAFSIAAYSMTRKKLTFPLPVLQASGVIASLCAVVAARRRRAVILRGDEDLVLDQNMSSLVLPELYGRGHRVIVPFDSVVELRIMHTQTDLKQQRSLLIIRRDSFGAVHAETLTRWKDEQKTNAFAQWLAARLGVAVKQS